MRSHGRAVWIVIAVCIGLAAFLALRISEAIGTKQANATVKSASPTVTVVPVGLSELPTTINIIGTIAARYDVPIGVLGDGGRVALIGVEAGDHVKRGQLLARLDMSVLKPQVTSLAAALDQARAEAELADAEYQRALKVGGSAGALSTEETERRHSSAVTAAAKVKVAAAQLAEAQARLDRTDIRAPADGTILTRSVELGQSVEAGGPALFRLAEGDEIELRGEVAEQDLPTLKVGQAAEVRLTGLPQTFAGHVRLLGAVIDPQTRMGTVRIALDPAPELRPGAFARAAVVVSKASRSVLPQTAVLSDEQGSYVFVVDRDNKIARHPVQVSGIVPNGVTIGPGLPSDARVVATAGPFLQIGETVKPVPATAGS